MKRAKIYAVAPEMVAAILRRGTVHKFRVFEHGIPPDGEVRHSSYDYRNNTFQFVIESKEFPEVPDNMPIPFADIPALRKIE